jgi:hypothetical protein
MSGLPVATVIAAVFLAVLSCGCIFIAVTVYPVCHYFHCHLSLSCNCQCQCLWNLLFVYIWKRHDKVKVFWFCISDIPAWDGQTAKLFFTVYNSGTGSTVLIKNKEQLQFSISIRYGSAYNKRPEPDSGHRNTNIRLQEKLFISKSIIEKNNK